MTGPACEHCPLAGTGLTCPRWTKDHPRFCQWVDPESPGYQIGGAETLVAMAEASPPASFPPLMEQARNLAGSVGRFVASGLKMTDPEERARRRAICHACEHFAGGKCRLCGCITNWAARIESKHCPDKPPRW